MTPAAGVRRFLECAALAAVYFVAAKLGLRLAFIHASATAVWPPTGIALAALLVLGPRVWPGVLAGAFLANATTQGSLLVCLGIALGNTLEALAGAWATRRLAAGRDSFGRAADVFGFALAGSLSAALSATCGVGSLGLGGFAPWSSYWAIWRTWWIGDAVSAVVVAPLLLAWIRRPRSPAAPGSAREAAALALVTLGIGVAVFAGVHPYPGKNYPIAFLCLPPLIWAALRFGPPGAALSTFALSCLAIASTLHGLGPFYIGSPHGSILLLQAFMGTIAVSALSVGAVAAENRRVLEELRRHAQEQYRRLFEESPVPMWVWHPDTHRFLEVNQAAIEKYGYSRQEFLAMRIEDIRPPEELLRLREYLSELALGRHVAGEWRHKRKDGSIIDVGIVSDSAMFDDQPARLTLATDITERKRAEEALVRQRQELARSNSDLEEFAYVASHDLQEPLRKMRSFSEILSKEYGDRLDEKGLRYLAIVSDGAARMQRLVADLLAYARVAHEGAQSQEVSMKEVLEQVLDDLRPALHEVGAEVESADLPELRANPTQMRQLLQNLLSNALKFRSSHAPRIRVSCRQEGSAWLFSVSDNGIGIDPAGVARLFQLFQRLHGPKEYPGSGLGLALCKKIVERCGGRIWVESEPGKGSNFFFTLPREYGR